MPDDQTAQQPPPPAPTAPPQAEPTDADFRSEAPPPGWTQGAWKRLRTAVSENAQLRQQVATLEPVKAEAEQWKTRHAQDSQAWGFEKACFSAGVTDPEGIEVAKALWNAKPAEQRGEVAPFLTTTKALQPYRANMAPGQQAQAQQAAPPPVQQQAAPPPPNPNGGAGQPAGTPGAQKWTDGELAKVRAANGGRLPPHVLAELSADPSLGLKNIPGGKKA
jgi:hypothetical protein